MATSLAEQLLKQVRLPSTVAEEARRRARADISRLARNSSPVSTFKVPSTEDLVRQARARREQARERGRGRG
jgi:hypothetical protein